MMYRKMKKRVLAMLLIFCMTGACLPSADVMAADAQVEEETAEGDVLYCEDFDGVDSLGENNLPAGWETGGKTIGEESGETGRTIVTTGERSYYRIDGSVGCAEYVGRVLNDLELPQKGMIEYDFYLEESAAYTKIFFCTNSVKPGTTAIRGHISKDGVVTFFNGATETKINAVIKDAGWVHFKYDYDNESASYMVEITDADGELIGKTDTAFSYKEAGAQVGAFAFNMTEAGIVLGIDNVKVKRTEERAEENQEQQEEDSAFYSEYFNDAGKLNAGIPDGWQAAGTIAGTYSEDGIREIRTEGDRSYYYIEAKAGEANKKYLGKVFSGALIKGTIEYDMKLQSGTDIIRLYSYEKSVYTGNLAIRGVIAADGTTTFFNGSNETVIGKVTYDEWLHFKYEYDNDGKMFTVEITNETGEILAKTEEAFSYNNMTDGYVGAFSFSMDKPSTIGVDDIVILGTEEAEGSWEEPDDNVAEIVEDEEETVFYSQNFDDSDQLQESGIPNGWNSTGSIAGTYTESGIWEIREEEERSYYYIKSKDGEQNKKYIGKVLSGISKTGWIEYDFNLINACEGKTDYPDIVLSFYPNSINSGNIGISGYITPEGEVYFYNSASPEKICSIQGAGWVHFLYEYNNNKKTYKVTITDKEGKEIGKTTGAYTYRNASGQVGAFSFSMNEPAAIGIDNISVHGYQTPFSFEPEIEPLEQTGKVVLEESADEYTLKNDYCKIVIAKQNAAIKKFYTKEGNEICGANGGGSYLLNYQDSDFVKVNSTDKQETALNNGVGSIIKQTDDYVEISVKEENLTKERTNNTSVLPIDVDFRFVLEADSPGLYMYAIVERTDEEEDRTFKIEQSRYAIKFDYERLPYSCVQNGELVKIPSPNDFEDMDSLFDSTYVLNDGSIYTKYNNLSYQYDNILVGAYSDEAGLSLLTPSREWAGGGYSKQDIDVHGAITGSSTVNWHLATSHNGTEPAELECGYKKIYGPIMWYASTDESITSKEAAYQDALAQAQSEAAKWPYQWLTDEDYAANERGSLKGSFSVKNGTVNKEVTNDLTPDDSIGWAVLSDTRSSSWTLDNAYYEFYAPVNKDGTFEITNILPGTYKLNINVNGVMDEYEQDDIVIGAGEEKNLGAIVWDDPVYGETLWTIGIPDRTAEEYAYALPYRYWGSHLLFNSLFPDGVDFTVGEDDYTKDWFFVQMASQTAGLKEHYDGAFYYDEESGKVKYDSSKAVSLEEQDERWRGNELTEFKIRFNSEVAYQNGAVGSLLINVCGNRSGTIKAELNGQSITPETVCLYSDGSVGRSGLVGINQLVKIEFDASLIKEGENVILLTHDHPAYQEDNETAWENSDYTIYAGNIYDAIRLDVDDNKTGETLGTENTGETPSGSETAPSEVTGETDTGTSESGESSGTSETVGSESSGTSETVGSETSESSGTSQSSETSESGGTSETVGSETSESGGTSETVGSETSESGGTSETSGSETSESGGTSQSSETSESGGTSETSETSGSESSGTSETSGSETSESGGTSQSSETSESGGTSETSGSESSGTSETVGSETSESGGTSETSGSETSESGGTSETSETVGSETSESGGTSETSGSETSESSGTSETVGSETSESGGTSETVGSETSESSGTSETSGSETSESGGTSQSSETQDSEKTGESETTGTSETAKTKGQTTVVLKNKTVVYNKKAVAIEDASIIGSTGSITYFYYTDAACTKQTTKENSGAEGTGQAPKYAGTYYVIANVAADDDYSAAVSNVAKLTIKKAASKVTLKKQTVRYTGKAISIKKAVVKGSTGKVTYTYYKDKKCKTKTTKKNAGAKKKGQAPKNVGTYYVKASVKSDKNYKAATSKAVKLVIKK